jgi:hypothetical protein
VVQSGWPDGKGGEPMSEPSRKKDVWVDSNLFNENSLKIPWEEQAKYFGKYVAWSLDGTKILMAGEYFDDLGDKMLAAGIDPSEVVMGYLEHPDDPAHL